MNIPYNFGSKLSTLETNLLGPNTSESFPQKATLSLGIPYYAVTTLQMFTGNYRDSTGKSQCRDFKFMGIACIPAIPITFKTHTLISIVIFEGNLILLGYYRDSLHQMQGKPCNNPIFGEIHVKYAAISCKFQATQYKIYSGLW